MKQSPLHEAHLSAKAKLIPFAGYSLPVWFSSIRDEHMAVRDSAGIFDISHMKTIRFTGNTAAEFLQRMTCNNVEKTAENPLNLAANM